MDILYYFSLFIILFLFIYVGEFMHPIYLIFQTTLLEKSRN